MGFHHIAIATRDIKASHEFYTGPMGFTLLKVQVGPAGERGFAKHLFYDTGNAFNDWADQQLEYSVGIGVRWKLPMLMIGIDVAQALSEPDKNPRLHLNITQVLR